MVCRDLSHLCTIGVNNASSILTDKPDSDENKEVGSNPSKTDGNKQNPGNKLKPKTQI